MTQSPSCAGPEKPGKAGPYRQSERTEIYLQYAKQLLEQGHAYEDFCTEQELEAMRAEAEKKGRAPVYTGAGLGPGLGLGLGSSSLGMQDPACSWTQRMLHWESALCMCMQHRSSAPAK